MPPSKKGCGCSKKSKLVSDEFSGQEYKEGMMTSKSGCGCAEAKEKVMDLSVEEESQQSRMTRASTPLKTKSSASRKRLASPKRVASPKKRLASPKRVASPKKRASKSSCSSPRRHVVEESPEDAPRSPTKAAISKKTITRLTKWGAKKPNTQAERKELKKKCGSKCFLSPKDLKFPICGTDCVEDCNALVAAKIRGAQWGYASAISPRLEKAWKRANCSSPPRKRKQ